MTRREPGARPHDPSTPPLVSIVIPVYDVAPYLERCLDSVFAQRHRPIEVIAVDDGSTDGSGAILERYADRHECLRVIRQDNQGPGPARNAGIAAATGTYLALVDADDHVAPDFISCMLALAEQTRADTVVCNFSVQLGRLTVPYPLMALPQHGGGLEAARQTLQLLPLPPFVWTKLYRRDWYAGQGFAFPAIYYEDVATSAPRLRRAGRVAATSRALYTYCPRRTGITGNFGVRNVIDYLTAVDTVRRFVHADGMWTAWDREYRRMLRFVDLLLTAQIGLQDNTIRLRDRLGLIRLVHQHLGELRAMPDGGDPAAPSIDPARYPLRRRRRDHVVSPPAAAGRPGSGPP